MQLSTIEWTCSTATPELDLPICSLFGELYECKLRSQSHTKLDYSSDSKQEITIDINFSLTEGESRSGNYWPSIERSEIFIKTTTAATNIEG